MSMSCNSGKFTKRKIIVLSLLEIGVAVGIYFAFSTNNPAVAAVYGDTLIQLSAL